MRQPGFDAPRPAAPARPTAGKRRQGAEHAPAERDRRTGLELVREMVEVLAAWAPDRLSSLAADSAEAGPTVRTGQGRLERRPLERTAALNDGRDGPAGGHGALHVSARHPDPQALATLRTALLSLLWALGWTHSADARRHSGADAHRAIQLLSASPPRL